MAQKPLLTEPISYEDAGKYLADIKDPDLLKVYETHLGGTFKANKLKNFVKKDGFSGLMFWFCLDNNNLFLACEPKFDFQYKGDEIFSTNLEPTQKKLIIPGEKAFGHDLKNVTDFEGFVKNHSQPNHLQDKEIPKLKVKNFKLKFEKHDLYKNHQKYGHAYFENKNNYVKDFFSIEGLKNVRYYLGYGDSYKPNYIRVILVPVDSVGNNIKLNKKEKKGELLQKSFPPPPYQ